MRKRNRISAAWLPLACLMALLAWPSAAQAAVDMADGEYTIDYVIKKADDDSVSIANDYFEKPAGLTVKNGEATVDIRMNHSAWITEFQVPSGGSYIDAPVVASDKAADTRTVRFGVDGLSAPLAVKMHVTVESIDYDHDYTVRFVFDTASAKLVKAAEEPPEAETPSAGPAETPKAEAPSAAPGASASPSPAGTSGGASASAGGAAPGAQGGASASPSPEPAKDSAAQAGGGTSGAAGGGASAGSGAAGSEAPAASGTPDASPAASGAAASPAGSGASAAETAAPSASAGAAPGGNDASAGAAAPSASAAGEAAESEPSAAPEAAAEDAAASASAQPQEGFLASPAEEEADSAGPGAGAIALLVGLLATAAAATVFLLRRAKLRNRAAADAASEHTT
ncbi:heme uptake protein IsdC [Cohnella algarum]|uniref:heme uptake protein IsdC n=1 Tax=Cohnella algarum TaxID=2044859 RepID=UPI0023DE0266|nr:heme uptake protein IsdC [Cohnella algarum]